MLLYYPRYYSTPISCFSVSSSSLSHTRFLYLLLLPCHFLSHSLCLLLLPFSCFCLYLCCSYSLGSRVPRRDRSHCLLLATIPDPSFISDKQAEREPELLNLGKRHGDVSSAESVLYCCLFPRFRGPRWLWTIRDNWARGEIHLCCEVEVQYIILDSQHAMVSWSILKPEFGIKGDLRVNRLKKEFSSGIMVELSCGDYIKRVKC